MAIGTTPEKSSYDYLIVGAGITGATLSVLAREAGKTCLVIDKRNHVAGNIHTEIKDGIPVHVYGAHIFHTSDRRVWDFVNRFAEFNNYINSPVANFHGELYNLPFNMNTFSKIWSDVVTPQDAQDRIREEVEAEGIGEPKNLEEQGLSLVGRSIFEKLIKGYTEKQWGRDCKDLPASIIRRLPCRFTYDNNYFNDRYQGIPIGGYTAMVERMLDGTEVILGVEYRQFIDRHPDVTFGKTLYCGPIDEFYGYSEGQLEYRSLRFETDREDCGNVQGVAVMNYTDRETPYTRIIEHKHFDEATTADIDVSYVTREYPADWKPGDEPYYPINDERNGELYERYVEKSKAESNIVFAGRLGGYKYYDMDRAIIAAMELAEGLFS